MTKQFNKLITDVGSSQVFNNIIDEATQQELIDYFYYRYLCDDDDKFIRYFQRNLKIYKNQYVQYLRIQNTTFDPMVSRYLERKYQDTYKRDDSSTEARQSTNNNEYTSNNSTTNTGTIDDDRTIKNDETVDNTQNITSNNTKTSNNKQTSIFSDMPQANVSGYTGQDIDNVDMTYATTMTVAKNNLSEQNEGTEGTTGNRTLDGTTTDKNTQTQDLAGTSNTTFTGNNTINGETTLNNTTEYDLTHKEIYTGRDDTPQELLDNAREYIVRTNAFTWLVSQLDKCFMCNLRYGEEV